MKRNLFRSITVAALMAFAVLSCTAFGGCAGTGTHATPQTTVYSAKEQFSMALSFANWYKNLAPCTDVKTIVVCSSPTVVDKLRVAANSANTAIQAAEDTVRTPGYDPTTFTGLSMTATNAVTALLQIILTIEQGNPAIAAAAPRVTP